MALKSMLSHAVTVWGQVDTQGQPLAIESKSGKSLGEITPLDAVANNHRRRCRPDPENTTPTAAPADSTVEPAYEHYSDILKSTLNN
ncbi:hypothetical protein MNBD_GAMMA24-2836, partial [hydrothermal vent metagenome]